MNDHLPGDAVEAGLAAQQPAIAQLDLQRRELHELMSAALTARSPH